MLRLENSNLARGQITNGEVSADIVMNGQISHAADYQPLIVGYHNGQAVRLSDVADVVDSVQNVRAGGYLNGKRAVVLQVFRQPNANIIDTVDRIKAALPSLEASIPKGINTTVVMDRTTTIRASVFNVERTLLISIVLVILVVFVFLRSPRAMLIPAVAVPTSLVGTFAVMYLCGYSLDNLSLMALTISTGFVVDDAIVVMENITRHIEDGMEPFAATLLGAREIGFTVMTISMSLIAVFIPLLMMGGIVGRLFREFAVTLSTAIVVSMAISLTTTPMMCAHLLKSEKEQKHGRMYKASERVFQWSLGLYRRSLRWVLENPGLVLTVLALIIALNVVIAYKIPKGFFPQQDTGSLGGQMRGPQDASYPAMNAALQQIQQQDQGATRRCRTWLGSRAAGTTNTGGFFVILKPLEQRKVSAAEVINRLRPTVEPDYGGIDVSAGVAGHPGGRTRGERDVPVHDPVGQRERPAGVGAEAAGCDHAAVRLPGREQRPAERRAGPAADLRPRDGGEAGADGEFAGFGAVLGVRPVAGVADLHATEPVLRCAGGCARVLGDSGRAEERVPASVAQGTRR